MPFINKSRHLDAVFARSQPLFTLTRARFPRYSNCYVAGAHSERYILPGSIEQDPGFQKEIQRLSHIGLRVVGGVEIASRSSWRACTSWSIPTPNASTADLFLLGSSLAIGGLTLWPPVSKRLYPHARFLRASRLLIAAYRRRISMLLMTQFDPTAHNAIPVNITLAMLVVAAAIPFRPTDMLLFGFLVESALCFAGLGRSAVL